MRWMGTVLAIVAVGGVAYLVFFDGPKIDAPKSSSGAASTTPTLSTEYTNATYKFTLSMPGDFKAQETTDPQTGSDVIALQNQSGDGIQILVSPFDEDTGSYTLTKERIVQDIPDLIVSDEQPVTIGANYVGLAFKSNNGAFDGDSREVWFVFHGNLYQISTYARLDSLLQAIFKTWQFN